MTSTTSCAALQYSEVVNIFEPATTTSLAPNLSSKDADMLHGIAGCVTAVPLPPDVFVSIVVAV